MNTETLYEERLSSPRTTALFAGLCLLFLALGAWRSAARGMDGWSIALLLLFGVFLFYVFNYRTLVIRLTPESLRLTFGLFSWAIARDNIAGCRFDDSPPFLKYGGAGIHFMTVHGRNGALRYRASFNFLEYPRLVVELRAKRGPVRDIAFSTRRPDEILQLLFPK
ncbi:MAG: hypothetical protein BWY25_02831 [Chloroflexi bacterium ADurb.Bin222]|nr:MAG: hypothetical protein BWY25_02831 [Chloroflexi bacterium ADurb.Bin222]